MAQAPPKAGPSEQGPAHFPKSNGVITDNSAPKGTAVNRKKQKRRQKQAAKQAAAVQDQQTSSLDYGVDDDYPDGQPLPEHGYPVPPEQHPGMPDLHYNDPYTARQSQYAPEADDQIAYSDEENAYSYNAAYATSNGEHQHMAHEPQKRRKPKKKGRSASAQNEVDYTAQPRAGGYRQAPPPPPPPPTISHDALNTVRHNLNKDGIWNTSSQEERLRIKEFWLDLPEDDRKSLVRIEKEAVLRKMKEQQKHSCSCTVCGRKRTAIEEELEVLYDAYYEELEQFANHNQQMMENGGPPLPHPHQQSHSHYPSSGHRPSRRRIQEIDDDDDPDEVFSEDEIDDEDDVDDEEYEEYDDSYSGVSTDEMIPPAAATDFFTFGNSLTVKGGILTVADDLLKNDGQKFIDMMEQLAERRMQREEDAQQGTYRLSHSRMDPSHSRMDPPPPHNSQAYPPPEADDQYDDEDEFSDEDDDDLDVEDDEMNTMTEAQRMEEGRRMFQIFAARMFEQRVLTAYREKVALERQQRLIEELDAEKDQKTLKDEKKQRDAEKKKAKKLQQKQEQARKKALKEEQKAAEEAAAREAEEARQEELKKKREEAKRKKEEQKKAQEEEKQRKEADKQRRLAQERQKQQEAERKAREEKKRKEESKKKEREEREAREKAVREKKAQEERERREAEEREKAAVSAREEKQASAASHEDLTSAGVDASRRAPAMVALPPGLRSQRSSNAVPSPQPKVATPILPGPPLASFSKEVPAPISQGSTPQTPEAPPQLTKQSTPPKPPSAPRSQAPSTPASRSSSHQYPQAHTSIASPGPGVVPHGVPPFGPGHFGSMHGPPGNPQQPPSGIMQSLPGRPAMIPSHPHALQIPHQPRQHMFPPMVGQPGMPNGPAMPPIARGFAPEPPPGFASHMASPMSGSSQTTFSQARDAMHSRQQSVSQDVTPIETPGSATNPIARPAPIKRPASVKPSDQHRHTTSSVDELSEHLGSSALLADSEVAEVAESRRPNPGPGLPNYLGSPFETNQGVFAPNMRSPSGTLWGPPPATMPAPGFGPTGWGSSSGWGAPGPQARTTSSKNLLQLRVLACQASQQLSSQRQTNSYHYLEELLGLVNNLRGAHEGPPYTSEDLGKILDSEGDRQNGGGIFMTDRDAQGRILVKWQTAAFHVGRAGQIGSPVVAPLHAQLGRGGL